jgi:hypothetical protein
VKSKATVLFINEESLSKSPLVEILLENYMKVRAILDSGSAVNLLAQSIYDKLNDSGADIATLPLENVILVTEFGKRSHRVRKQAMIAFTIGKELFDVNFFISPQFVNNAILGCQFMKEYGINLNFEKESFTYFREGGIREHSFYQPTGALEVGHSNRSSKEAAILTQYYTRRAAVEVFKPASTRDSNSSATLLPFYSIERTAYEILCRTVNSVLLVCWLSRGCLS